MHTDTCIVHAVTDMTVRCYIIEIHIVIIRLDIQPRKRLEFHRQGRACLVGVVDTGEPLHSVRPVEGQHGHIPMGVVTVQKGGGYVPFVVVRDVLKGINRKDYRKYPIPLLFVALKGLYNI